MSAPSPAAPEAERRRGYARWHGERAAQGWRWWVIARGNLSLALASRWLKFVLIASLAPGVILAGITYFFLPLSATVLSAVMSATIVFAFLVAALAGARLISEDRRQGAFLAHFARPVRRWDYLAGKFVALALLVLFVVVASPLLAIAADASVDSTTFVDRLREVAGDIPDEQGYLRQASYGGALGAVLWFGLIVSLSTTGIMLGLSALTTRPRVAGVIWFAIVAFGAAAAAILGGTLRDDWPALLSWSDNVADVASFLVGLEDNASQGRDLEFDLATRAGVLLLAGAAGVAVVHEMLRRSEGGVR